MLDRRWPIPTRRTAFAIGGWWLALTALFEFGFGHYVAGKSLVGAAGAVRRPSRLRLGPGSRLDGRRAGRRPGTPIREASRRGRAGARRAYVMSARILVAYATRAGSTAEVAEAIGRVLRAARGRRRRTPGDGGPGPRRLRRPRTWQRHPQRQGAARGDGVCRSRAPLPGGHPCRVLPGVRSLRLVAIPGHRESHRRVAEPAPGDQATGASRPVRRQVRPRSGEHAQSFLETRPRGHLGTGSAPGADDGGDWRDWQKIRAWAAALGPELAQVSSRARRGVGARCARPQWRTFISDLEGTPHGSAWNNPARAIFRHTRPVLRARARATWGIAAAEQRILLEGHRHDGEATL